ncbi:MAG: hypothetical protein ACYDBB_13550 [Armatimonadota bacterium]
MMRYLTKISLGFLLLLGALSAHAASTSKTGDSITMQNELVKLTIDLKTGARVDTFVYKSFGENIIYPVASCGGLLMDHVWEQTWPGEFLYRKYDGEVVKNGPDEAVVKVWSTGTETTTKGIRFERLITLKEGERALRCKVSLTNTTNDGKVTGYWNQNNFWFGSAKENMTWARPAVRGIDHLGLDATGEPWFGNSWFYIDDATAGWNSAFNKGRQQGMMCLMDYNDLWRIYDNSGALTTEWMYDKVAIPGGKTWTTEITLIPVAGVTGFKHGSANVIANFEATKAPGGLSIEHQVSKSLIGLMNVTLTTKVWGLKKEWTATVPEAKFAELTDAVQKTTVKATGVEAMPAGIQVTITGTAPDGKQVSETYGDYFGGEEGKNNDPFSMKPYLAFERPAKQKVYLKPDVIAYTPNAEPKVLYLRGMWHEFFRADEAIKAAFPKATVTDGWLDSSPVGLAVSYFPGDYPSLTSFDLIILGNVPAAPIDLVGQEMLKDYLVAGGNLLILGGDHAFGQAGFTNTGFIDALPIELGGQYNWRKIKGDNKLKVTADVPATKDITFGAKDIVLYSHLCKPKAGATVAAKAGENPILVLGATPKGGRIACVLATPFGEAATGETAFWDAPAWRTLMQNTVQWLVKRQ